MTDPETRVLPCENCGADVLFTVAGDAKDLVSTAWADDLLVVRCADCPPARVGKPQQ